MLAVELSASVVGPVDQSVAVAIQKAFVGAYSPVGASAVVDEAEVLIPDFTAL